MPLQTVSSRSQSIFRGVPVRKRTKPPSSSSSSSPSTRVVVSFRPRGVWYRNQQTNKPPHTMDVNSLAYPAHARDNLAACTLSVNAKFTATSKFSARWSFSDLSSMAKAVVRPLAAHVQVLVRSV
eukprot:3792707-Prymnesium_polylepis.1